MKKALSILLVLLLICTTFISCGKMSSSEQNFTAPSAPKPDVFTEEDFGTDDTKNAESATSAEGLATHGLKIVYSATLRIEALDYDASYASIQSAIKHYDGYISNEYAHGGQSYSNSSYSPKSTEITIRIPVENYQAFLDGSEKFGNVLSTSTSSEDITSQYIDTEARLSSLTTQETRLLEMLSKATKLEDLISLEDHLSRIRYEIETYTSTLKTYENLVSYTTITINLNEVNSISVNTNSFGSRILGALQGSLSFALVVLQSIVVLLIYVMPYLIIAGIILFVVLKINRYRKNKANKNTNINTQKQP